VSLNTGDPGWFATDLVHELEIATEMLAVSPEQHRAMQLDAVAASFLSAEAATLRQAIAAH
jgi:adenosine deaminase